MTRSWRIVLLLQVVACAAWAHDLSLDVGASFTATSETNPRTGGASLNLAGTFDLNDSLSVFGNAQFTRDLPTRTPDTASLGSNIFFFGLGVAVAPSRHWLLMASATGSPPSLSRNATVVENPTTGVTNNVVVSSRAWSLGGLVLGTWASAGLSSFEHLVDGFFGVTWFDVAQRLELPNTAPAQQVRMNCEAMTLRTPFCALVLGARTPLAQFKLGLGYTATLGFHTDVGLEGAYYLYDKDPTNVGYFSLLMLGRVEVGTGVPVLPLQLSLRPSLIHRFKRVTLRIVYQLGLYPEGEGSNHAFSAKVTWKVTKAWRVWLSGTTQFDATQDAVHDPAGTAVLGALVEF